MGHMKANRSGTRSTTKTKTITDTNNNNNNSNTDGINDGSFPILESHRLHLELAVSHNVACGVTNIRTNEPKGTLNTDLPGRFPFTSSRGNSYIFCMYDYNINIIWSYPIKSRNKANLIIGFESCYKQQVIQTLLQFSID